ncbi:MAG TPA: zinc-dependent metalloprotease, partial [Xanthomonadales bacterium]|nr:zinc-dependent metalloprotease [Xanthomonadales bacterium]
FTNPRTGQIIGADIMLEYSFMTRLTRTRGLIHDPVASEAPALPAIDSNFGAGFCALGQGLAMNSVFARAAADVYGYSDELDQQLTRDTMHYLILHEMGHTLGMNHNMKATQFRSPDEAWDKAVLSDGILAGSVMDYPAVNFAPTREQQSLFYTITPGPYDDWFIEYGYSEAVADPAAEQQRLDAILARSTDPLLVFGNDADDMRAPGAGMDPRVNIYDMSDDAVVYASRQMAMMQETLNGLTGKLPEAGKSYQEVFEAVSVIMNLWGRSASVTSRYVGGVYVDRAMVGQDGGGQPFTPVEEARQRQAMEVLNEQVFAPDAFVFSPELLSMTAPQRRSFDHFGKTEDPKIHDAVLAIQKGVLDHLLNPVVLKRVSDSTLYGNTYTIGEVFNDMTDAVFAADAKGNVNSFRRNLQTEYVTRLAAMVKGEGYDNGARSMAVYSLNSIEDLLEAKRNTNVETQAHVQNLELIIERALSADV